MSSYRGCAMVLRAAFSFLSHGMRQSEHPIICQYQLILVCLQSRQVIHGSTLYLVSHPTLQHGMSGTRQEGRGAYGSSFLCYASKGRIALTLSVGTLDRFSQGSMLSSRCCCRLPLPVAPSRWRLRCRLSIYLLVALLEGCVYTNQRRRRPCAAPAMPPRLRSGGLGPAPLALSSCDRLRRRCSRR